MPNQGDPYEKKLRHQNLFVRLEAGTAGPEPRMWSDELNMAAVC